MTTYYIFNEGAPVGPLTDEELMARLHEPPEELDCIHTDEEILADMWKEGVLPKEDQEDEPDVDGSIPIDEEDELFDSSTHVQPEDWWYSGLSEAAIRSIEDAEEEAAREEEYQRQYGWIERELDQERAIQRQLRADLVAAKALLASYCESHPGAAASTHTRRFEEQLSEQQAKSDLSIVEVCGIVENIKDFITSEHEWTSEEESKAISHYDRLRYRIVKDIRRLHQFCTTHGLTDSDEVLKQLRKSISHKLETKLVGSLDENDVLEFEQAVDAYIGSHSKPTANT